MLAETAVFTRCAAALPCVLTRAPASLSLWHHQAAAAWSGAKPPGTDAADWCYLQLRKHACAITQAADDTSLQLPTRQALHRLQLQILAGNLGLAARQGHQVRTCSGTNRQCAGSRDLGES